MARYTGWRRLSGDTADRPDLLDMGKKLLGELQARRAASGIKTCVLMRQMPDGSLVRARFIGDLPEITVHAPPPPGKKGEFMLFDGFSLRRTREEDTQYTGSFYGTAGAEQDGHHLEMGLMRAENLGGADKLLAYWHSEEWKPEDGAERYLEPVFLEDGLLHTANLDWQGKCGVLQFFGPMNRVNDPLQYYNTYVFHNGAVLFDTDEIEDELGSGPSWRVMGCALAKRGTVLRMLVCRGGGVSFEYQAVEVDLESGMTEAAYGLIDLQYHPRLKPKLVDEVIVPRVLAYLEIEDIVGFRSPGFFNQSGNEARSIEFVDDGSGAVRIIEVVLRFEDDGAVFSQTDLGETTTTTIQHTTTAGAVSLGVPDIENIAGPVTFPARPDVEGGEIPAKAATSVHTETVSTSLEWAIVAVDFREDVPVYLEVKALQGQGTNTVTFGDRIAAGTGSVEFNSLGGVWTSPLPDAEGTITWQSTDALAEEFAATVRSDWFTLTSLATRTRDNSTAWDGEVQVDDLSATAVPIGGGTTTTAEETVADTHVLLFVDLRHKILAYKRTTTTVTDEATAVTEYVMAGGVYATMTTTGTRRTEHRVAVRTEQAGRLVAEDVLEESDVIESLDDTAEVPGPFGSWSPYNAIFLQVPVGVADAEATFHSEDTDADIEPPQLGSFDILLRDDYWLRGSTRSPGSWVVSRDLMAFSYAIVEQVDVDPPTAESADYYRSGLFDLRAGTQVLTPTLLELAVNPELVRFYPIFAVSPFAAVRRI